MPAQLMTGSVKQERVLLPANSSEVALVKSKAGAGDSGGGGGGLLGVQFSPPPLATSGRVSLRQWLTVAVLVYVNLINYMDRLTLAGILEQIKDEFGANNAMGGLLQTAFIVSYMLFAPLFGYLGDRYSRKAIMAFGVFLWAIFTLVGSFISGSEEQRGRGWANKDFWLFLGCRAMVGIGEASYSTIAPTIISDMFVKDLRSKMLALFYFAIPVGSGLGYIVGSETARLLGGWQWGLRATPVLGIVAVILILTLMVDPPRGESEGHQELQAATYTEDLASLGKNKSFVFSTLAFTCVTFCTGALSWWGPIYIQDALRNTPEPQMDVGSVPFTFGAVTMVSGIIGVPLGMVLSTKLKPRYPRADPLICATGILSSALFLGLGMLTCTYDIYLAFSLLFLGEVTMNLNWSIVADMLLYIVVPTCRGTAEAVQILASHAFGDAGSPYLIGIVSDGLYSYLSAGATLCPPESELELEIGMNSSTAAPSSSHLDLSLQIFDNSSQVDCLPASLFTFTSLQYAFFANCGVEVLGGILFLVTAVFIVRDKLACETAVSGLTSDGAHSCAERGVMLAQYSPDVSVGEDDEDEDDEMIPQLKLLDRDSSLDSSESRTPSPVVC